MTRKDERFDLQAGQGSDERRWEIQPMPPRPMARPSAQQSRTADDGIELREILRILRRHVWLVAFSCVAITAAMGYKVLREAPQYTASALVRVVDSRGAMAGGMESRMASNIVGTWTDPVLSQILVLEGREVLGNVVDEQNLRVMSPEPRFPLSLVEHVEVLLPPEVGDEFLAEFDEMGFALTDLDGNRASTRYGVPIQTGSLVFSLAGPPGVDEAVIWVAPREDAIDALNEALSANPREQTDGIDVGYAHSDSIMAERVVNAVVDAYRMENLRSAQSQATKRRVFLEEQLATTESLLSEAQLALSRFKSREEVGSSSQRLVAQQTSLMDLDMRAQELDSERRMYGDLLRQVDRRRGSSVGLLEALVSSPGVAANPVVETLYEQLIEYETAMDSMTTGQWARSLSHPDVQRVSALRDTAEERLKEALESHKTSLDAQYGALLRLRNTHAAELRKLPTSEAEEFRLAQEVETISLVGDQLRSEYQRARVAEAVEEGQVEIVQLAGRSETVPSNKPMKMALALMLGLMLGGGGAFLVENLNTSIRRREDLEAALQVPELAFVPSIQASAGRWRRLANSPAIRVLGGLSRGKARKAGSAEAVVSLGSAPSAPSEAYRTLRTNLIFSQAAQAYRTVLVSSPGAGEGKTTTAVNLAAVYAQQNQRVLLLDCDLRKPQVAHVFGLKRSPGLVNVLAHGIAPEDAVRLSGVHGLEVMTTGPLPPNPSELLGSEEMGKVLEWARQNYDMVILDSPPLLAAADASVLASQVDGTLLVIRAGSTDREEAERARYQLDTVGARLLGAVLNDPDQMSDGVYGAYYDRYYAEAG